MIILQAVNQHEIDYMASHLDIRYDVVSNFPYDTSAFDAQITLINTGNEAIKQGSWEIHFSHIRMIEPDHMPNPDGYQLGNSGLKVYHINGCAFKISPIASFQTIQPNGQLVVNFKAQNWEVVRTDVMPNWYVVGEGLTARTILSTSGESLSFVGDFDKQEKWKRYWSDNKKDYYNPYTPKDRLQRIDFRDFKKIGKQLIPTPIEEQIVSEKKIYLGTKDWVIVHHPSLVKEAEILSENVDIPISNEQPGSRYISLQLGQVLIDGAPSNSSEAYYIQSSSDGQTIVLIGAGTSGAFYAGQSLLNLLDDDKVMPEVLIKDSPRFAYRGMHLDIGRNFQRKGAVLRLIQAMARYKMNKLHLHLTEDEGWRLQIPGLDELTSMGSLRCHDPQETRCVLPQLGSGPGVSQPGSGFYTVSDYKEILTLANKYHIEVIPEFDMPGHAHAAIKAMELKNDPNFRLSDPQDVSKYLSVQMFIDNAINPCLESSYTFVDHVIKAVTEMHRDIQPLKVFHFGGDEVASKAWTGSPVCVAKKPLDNSTNVAEWMEELKEEFVQRVGGLVDASGLDLGGWEDGFIDGHESPYNRSKVNNRNAIAYAWQNVWEWKKSNRAYKLANAGYQVVMSHATHLYFDHPYEPDPEERGYYWAPRYIDTRKTFGFMPENLYRNADVTQNGEALTEDQLCSDGHCVPLSQPQNIIGIQGQLWSETVRTEEQMDALIFPRLVALAERAWHKASWESVNDSGQREILMKADWEQFVNTLGYRELRRLDDMGIEYRVPPPGAEASGSVITVRSAVPGLITEYRETGANDWCSTSGTITTSQAVEIRTRSPQYSRVHT